MRNLKERVEKLAGDGKTCAASSPHLPQMFCAEQHMEQINSGKPSPTEERDDGKTQQDALLGIWEGKVQVAREGQTSEKEKAND